MTDEDIIYPKIEIRIEDENGTLPEGFFSNGEMTWNGGSMSYSEHVKVAIIEEVKRRIENGLVQDNVIVLPRYIGLRGRTLEQYRKRHGLQMYYPRYNDPRPPFSLAPFFDRLWQEQQARQPWTAQEEQPPVNWQSLDEAIEAVKQARPWMTYPLKRQEPVWELPTSSEESSENGEEEDGQALS